MMELRKKITNNFSEYRNSKAIFTKLINKFISEMKGG